MSSASALFLTLDRCLALKYPTEYKLWIGRYFAAISVCGLAALALVAWINILVEIPLDVDKVRNCQTFNCIATKYRNTIPAIIRLTFGGINVLVGCYFVILLRATITAHKHNNRLVRITIIMDVSLNFLPAAIGQIFPLIIRSSAGYLAQTAVWLFSLNIAVCSYFYVRILLKRNYSTLIYWCKQSTRVQRDRLFTQSTYPTTAISSTVTGE
ncbi:hypothetical protein DdX_17754 [Ditylenchus destructor]|uniref:Uncharacterized protein n=1 Tax=Ditylenchus destructor TaxID=166010 RepID=A0AAD4QT87_9BILA|nr:hypothetical protein DdX_17754 [Ditylenchus destructor]